MGLSRRLIIAMGIPLLIPVISAIAKFSRAVARDGWIVAGGRDIAIAFLITAALGALVFVPLAWWQWQEKRYWRNLR